MNEYELKNYIGKKIRYVIPRHFDWKQHSEGVGLLDYCEDQNWWQILLNDGKEFLLHEDMLPEIDFDREEKMLTFFYFPNQVS